MHGWAGDYQRIRRSVEYVLLRKRGARRDDVRDLVQEVFTRLAASARPIQDVIGFAVVITRNLSIDRARTRRFREDCRSTVESRYGEHWETRDPCRILCGAESLAGLSKWVEAMPTQRRHTWWSVRVLGERYNIVSERYRVGQKATERHVRLGDAHVAAAPDYPDWCSVIGWTDQEMPRLTGGPEEEDPDGEVQIKYRRQDR